MSELIINRLLENGFKRTPFTQDKITYGYVKEVAVSVLVKKLDLEPEEYDFDYDGIDSRMPQSLPNVKKPCKDCPFRKDTLQGWLGRERMEEILQADSFACHKTLNKTRLQCAGHMLINGTDNGFVRLAGRLGITLDLSGRELVFDTRQACIKHHE